MHCPICARLSREHKHACQEEANATIKRRSELLGRPNDLSILEQLDQEVLRSRKRQAHLAFELREHRNSQHKLVARAAAV